MMIGFNKIEATFKIFVLYFFLWIILALTGCGGGNADIPPASVLSSGKITLSWNEVPGAAAYDIYMSTSAGVTTLNSYKISGVTPPITITDLEPGSTYYFIVTVYDDSGNSRKSKEISYTIADTEGSIVFGDLIGQTEPDDRPLQPAKTGVSTTEENQPVVKKAEPPVPATTRTKAGSEIIICFGDSLTAGIGAGAGKAYPAQLAKMIGKPVINRGISGDTTASARRRLNRDVLSAEPDIVLITLGGNDLKNGVAKNIAFGNLKYIVETIQNQGARVIIGGLKFPGRDQGFGQGYEDLAQQTGATLIPDIFAGIVDNPSLMSDPIHPNNAGYRIIAQRFNKALESAKKMGQSVSKQTAPAAAEKPVPAAAKKALPAATTKSKQAVSSSAVGTRDVTLAWDNVPGATAYNIYWSDQPGVTRKNGTKIGNAKNPHQLKDLIKGKKYYFVVTAVNQSGESSESAEFSFTVGE